MSDLAIGLSQSRPVTDISGAAKVAEKKAEKADQKTDQPQTARYDTVEISGEAKAATSKYKETQPDWTKEELVGHFMWQIEQTRQGNQVIPDYQDSMSMPVAPKRKEGESDEDFQRRKLSYDTSYSWKANLKQWLETSDGWGMGEMRRYLDEQSTAWVTDLMENSPAMFRTWLERSVKNNVDHGDYDVAIVPKGFTIADYNQWMSKGVLDYL